MNGAFIFGGGVLSQKDTEGLFTRSCERMEYTGRTVTASLSFKGDYLMSQVTAVGNGLLMFGCRIGFDIEYAGAFGQNKIAKSGVFWGYNSSLSYF